LSSSNNNRDSTGCTVVVKSLLRNSLDERGEFCRKAETKRHRIAFSAVSLPYWKHGVDWAACPVKHTGTSEYMSSRLQVFWNGVRQGVKFGSLAGAAIWVGVYLTCLCIFLFIPHLRDRVIAESDSGWKVLCGFGRLCITTVLVAAYGAIAGAIVMGIAAILRANRSGE
jgi:hypothetical protein